MVLGHAQGYGKDTLRPVTIKQINDAVLPHPDADFRIDNVDITQARHPASHRLNDRPAS